MKSIICFNTHKFEEQYLEKFAKKFNAKIKYTDKRLDLDTVHLVKGYKVILCWANDKLDKDILYKLKELGCEMISLRSAGYSHIDIEVAKKLNFVISRVPSYSPESIAEHAVTLYLSLNRKIPRANQRIKDFNFSLDGLDGHQVFGKTIGVIGAGLIGQAFVRIMLGFGCKILIYDTYECEEFKNNDKIAYTDLNTVLKESDVISLHCPLTEQTHHILNHKSLKLVKPNVFILNTGRGGLINTKDLIQKLKNKEIGAVGLDVYEFEENIFFYNHSHQGIPDDDLVRLMSFPNVLITSHQAFFTAEALENLASISIANAIDFLENKNLDSKNIIISKQQ